MSRTKKRKVSSLAMIALMMVALFGTFNLPRPLVAEEVTIPPIEEELEAPLEEEPPVTAPAPTAEPPRRPTGLVVEDAGTGLYVLLRWEPITDTNIAGYIIQRAEGENGTYSRVGNDSVDTEEQYFLDETVERNRTYRYTVSAVSGDGLVSAPSEPVSVTVTDVTPPAVVSADIVERDSGHELKITWQQGSEDDLAEYRVYRAAADEAEFTQVAILDSEKTQYVDQGLVQGQWYRYYLTAVDGSGNMSDRSEILEAKPRAGIRIPVDSGSETALPSALHAELNSNALFLGIQNDSIRMSARAIDEDGVDVPVTGTWRFAADFGSFRRVRAEGASMALAHFYADHVGDGEIAAEFYPQGSVKPVIAVAVPVRALDWYLRFDAPSSAAAAAGGEHGLFTATVTDGEGQPVTEPAARVRFDVSDAEAPRGNRLKANGLTSGRSASQMTVVDGERKLGVPGGSPDELGQVNAVFEASQNPGRDWVRAILYYDDYSGNQAHPKVIAESHSVRMDVEPGEAAFLAWEPAVVELDGAAPMTASFDWYDAYGNRTAAPADVTVWVQVPERMPFEIKANGGWIAAGYWIELAAEQKLQIRAAGDVEVVREGTYLVNTKVEGETGLPPAGLGQANRPLQIFVGQDFVPPRQNAPWVRDVGALAGGLVIAAAALWREMLLSGTRGV